MTAGRTGRPPIGEEPREEHKLSFDPGVWEDLTKYADEEGMSRSEAVNRLLRYFLTGDGEEPTPAKTKASRAC